MLDYQRIVEEIQAAVASQDAADFDLLLDTATEYAAVCEEVNDRLAECQRLLKQGLRSEAIQVAEREPNLLDNVALLDFPELEQWRQLLKAKGMVAPPALRIEVATDLNAAYADEAPLLSLLKSHRLLALGRAPLAARIQVLRKIRLADIMTSVWTDDLKLLETARHQELLKELETAFQNRSLDRATSLVHELDSEGWVYPPPPQLATQAKQRHQRLAAALATEGMERIEKDLSSAYTALDVKSGRTARAMWESCRQVAGLSNNHPLVQRAAAAIAWLDEEGYRQQIGDDFARAIARLENALESDSSRSSLERLFHAARRFDEEIPPRLLRRYQDRLRALEITARRRFTLAATVSVVALLLIAVGVGWFIYDAQREESVLSAARALARLVDDKNVAEAQRYYDDLNRKDQTLAARPEIQQELGRLNGLVATEANRKKSFEAMLIRATQAGADEPDRSALNEAEKVAKSLDEKSRVAEWRGKVNAADRERQQKRDQRFEANFKTLLTDVEELEHAIQAEQRLGGSGGRRLFGQIDQVLARIDNVKQGANGVTTALLGQIDPLRIRVEALRRQVADAQVQQASLQRLTTAAGRPEAYQAALEAFIKDNPNSPLSGELKRVVEEAKWWKDLDRWKGYLGDFHFSQLGKINAKDAKDLLARGETLLKDAGDSPLANLLKNKQAYLQHVANRVDQTGKARLDALETLFDNRRISSLWMVQRATTEQAKTEMRHYFLREKPDLSQPKSGAFPLQVITGFDFSEKTQSVPAADIRYADRSPQAIIAAELKNRFLFRRIKDGEWEKGFLELISLIADQKNLDPLLHLILLRHVVETAKEGSHSLDEVLGPLWAKIDDTQVDLTANWLWPDDDNAKRSRELASAKLAYAESLNEYARQTAQILRSDAAPLPPLPTWVGWLHPTGADSWTCEGPNALSTTGELFVLGPMSKTSGIVPGWKRVGFCQASGIRWETASDGRFLVGRPVYHFQP